MSANKCYFDGLSIKVPRGESPMAHHEERFATNVAERFLYYFTDIYELIK